LGRLDSVSTLLPDTSLFLYMYVLSLKLPHRRFPDLILSRSASVSQFILPGGVFLEG